MLCSPYFSTREYFQISSQRFFFSVATSRLQMKRTKCVAKSSELSFFKVISTNQKMEFPPGSVARMQGILGGKVTLRDVDKNLWTVEVKRGGNDFYFDKGWPQFYHENHLEPRDILTFEYKHDNLFDFILLGRDACGKKGVGCPRFRVKEEEFNDDDELVASPKKRVKEEEMEIEMLMKESKSRPSSSSPSLRHKKRDINDYYGHDIFRSGLAIRPKNPYFVSRSRKSRKNELYIPKEVIEGWKLKIESRMLVVDASGRKWESRMNKWKDGRLWCSGGWKRMCSANNIGAHDACICEFVQQDALYMLVHVVYSCNTS